MAWAIYVERRRAALCASSLVVRRSLTLTLPLSMETELCCIADSNLADSAKTTDQAFNIAKNFRSYCGSTRSDTGIKQWGCRPRPSHHCSGIALRTQEKPLA